MCGIAGYISNKFSINESEFLDVLQNMNHRGPDAEGIFSYNNLFLGHKRLSILDLSESANQPMTSSCDRYTIVYNGEIYNFETLAKQYKLKLKTRSDTEIILELFAIVGEKLPYLLNGMFAFVIFDKEENSFFIARDRMGIKPLFYFLDENVFAFSSELKAITKFKYITDKLKLNYEAIKSYLHLGYIPFPHSIYKNIKKFPQSNSAFYKNNILQFNEFWNINSEIKPSTINNESEAISKLNELLTDSVKLRMFCDVPFGTLLSGGIDSGIISAIASSTSKTPINTYTIGFKEQQFNEAPFASKMSKHLNTNHHEYILSEKDAIDLIPNILSTYDEPFADSSAIPTMLVSKMAAADVKMVLSGDGGDELFHGYGAYKWANKLANPFYSNLRNPISKTLQLGNNRQKRVSELFNYRNIDNLQSHIFSQEQYFFSKQEIEKMCLQNLNSCESFIYNRTITNRKLSPAEIQSLFDLQYYLSDDLLVKVDRASMKYSLEVRIPFLDYRIISFALNLHDSLKIKNGEQKYLLKQFLKQFFPSEFFERPKKGFSIPLNKWLNNELSYLIDEYLNIHAINKTQLFNYENIAMLVKKFKNGDQYLYNRLWNIIILQMFLLKK